VFWAFVEPASNKNEMSTTTTVNVVGIIMKNLVMGVAIESEALKCFFFFLL
jgi:hypothetical protein